LERRQKYRLRLETCIGTIIDVHKSIRFAGQNHSVLEQFEELKKAVTDMDMAQVSEQDIVMVEQATNALLYEYTPVFRKGAQPPVYNRIRH